MRGLRINLKNPLINFNHGEDHNSWNSLYCAIRTMTHSFWLRTIGRNFICKKRLTQIFETRLLSVMYHRRFSIIWSIYVTPRTNYYSLLLKPFYIKSLKITHVFFCFKSKLQIIEIGRLEIILQSFAEFALETQ